MKTLSFIIFGFAALAQWALPLAGIWQHEQVLEKGTVIKLKCTAPDPYDPLRGRFLAVNPVQREVTLPQGLEVSRGSPVYVTLTQDDDGLSTLGTASLTPPDSGLYIRLKAGYVYSGDKLAIEWPFSRLYLNEKIAPEADKWFAENIRGAEGVVAEVRVLDGRMVLEDLSLDGKPFREILKQRMK